MVAYKKINIESTYLGAFFGVIMKAILALCVFIICAGSGLYYFYDHMQQQQLEQQARTQQLIEQQRQQVIEQRKQLGRLPMAERKKSVDDSPIAERKKLVENTPIAESKTDTTSYVCDGRTYCSQMHSLEEARWFVRHCPNTKMDGDHDGEPCESDSRWH